MISDNILKRIRTNIREILIKRIYFFKSDRVAKLDPKVGSRRTTKISNLVVLVNILVALIWLPYYMSESLVLILLFLLAKER